MKLGWDIISIFYCGLQSKNLKAADVDRLLKRAFFFQFDIYFYFILLF